jgi:(1->4)-alpha-D-glucan 1-alpha-D-glucosylmutase
MNPAQRPDSESTLDLLRRISGQRRLPSATYRVQFNCDFTFRDARLLVDYLSELGITDIYASPCFKACSGSRHGYDICDPTQLNPELGDPEEFDAFSAACQASGMGLILDVVPCHMGIRDASNVWWFDVLENGPSSAYASFFDLDFHPAKVDLENKVLLPLLDDQYGRVFESGKLRLVLEEGAFLLRYEDIKLPVAPRTYSQILSRCLEQLQPVLDEQHEHLLEMQSILTALNYLPARTELLPDRVAERSREKEVIKRRLAVLCRVSPAVRSAMDSTLLNFNGTVGEPHSFDLLDVLIESQAYRLAFWKVTTEEINYRRFCDINELVVLRAEVPEVFKVTHSLVFQMLSQHQATGLRIDHADGLWDPRTYFRRLQESYLLHCVRAAARECTVGEQDLSEMVSRWLDQQAALTGPERSWPLYVVAEKCLSQGEGLPADWAVYGTTGYDFLAEVNRLLTDARQERQFDRIYSQFTAAQTDFKKLAIFCKKRVMHVAVAGDISALAYLLDRISEKNRRYRDFTLNSLTHAIREVIACLPVHRTYVDAVSGPSPHDQWAIETAVEEARRQNPGTAREIFDFIRDTLLLTNVEDFRPEDRSGLREFVMRFQQMTGPVMAKGVGDTAFYVYNRLVSLNEIGGRPEQFGGEVEDFHQSNVERLKNWPHSMLATSTHDTKRSEDVRARIQVLSEIPKEWQSALTRWGRLNAYHRVLLNGDVAPDRNDEYLLYQTLLGAWPDGPISAQDLQQFRERILAYMQKAAREAKVHTNWVNPDEDYERALRHFVLGTLDDHANNLFLRDFQQLQQRVAFYGRLNSLTQTLLKLTSPGVPDIYQGTELWDYSLVDPDNRRPVDYERRRGLLQALKQQLSQTEYGPVPPLQELLGSPADGRLKLFLILTVLNFRRRSSSLFKGGKYVPLKPRGERMNHVCAFARTLETESIIVIVPRLPVGLTDGKEIWPLGRETWERTVVELPSEITARVFHNLFTGEKICTETVHQKHCLMMSNIFRSFPQALLVA